MTPRDARGPVVRTTVDEGRRLVVDLDGSPGSVRAARLAAEHFLAAPPRSARADVPLVVAELVANACRHAPGPCRLTLRRTADGVEVAVHDEGSGWLRLASENLTSGYGLLIVTRLTGGIHVLPEGAGKVVRATVPLLGAGPNLG